jgi:hypothetical protein
MGRIRLIITAIVAALVLAVAFGCSDKTTEPEPTPPPTLMGKWEWVLTTGPDIYLTPENQGYDMFLIFNEDSTYAEYRDESLIYRGTFSVGDSVYWMDEWMRVLTLEDYLFRKNFAFHTNDTLVLADSIQASALISKYKKARQ